MNKFKKILVSAAALTLLTGCSVQPAEPADVTVAEAVTNESGISETVPEQPVYTPTEADIMAAEWFLEDMTDEENFTDLKDYQYYARTLGLDKDALLNPEMWEVYYNEQIVNLNKDIDNKEIYLIRLNPYKLLDIFAANNGITVDELCTKLSVSKEQLYYNWGYNPASDNYADNHMDGKVSYSAEEIAIFGRDNGENRAAVMSTHMIIADHEEGTALYSSDVSEALSMYRSDMLNITTDKPYYYSRFTDVEKNPAYKMNGIGIRAVIPLSLPNAYVIEYDKDETPTGDENISVMINVSPFTYGCTDEDKLDMVSIINMLYEEEK